MRHASGDPDKLEPMLWARRDIVGLTERSRRVVYPGSQAFLHLHADRTATTSTSVSAEFERHRVATASEQDTVVALVRARW